MSAQTLAMVCTVHQYTALPRHATFARGTQWCARGVLTGPWGAAVLAQQHHRRPTLTTNLTHSTDTTPRRQMHLCMCKGGWAHVRIARPAVYVLYARGAAASHTPRPGQGQEAPRRVFPVAMVPNESEPQVMATPSPGTPPPSLGRDAHTHAAAELAPHHNTSRHGTSTPRHATPRHIKYNHHTTPPM